jgi:futalosine hydrolase
MIKKIAIVAATSQEMAPLKLLLKQQKKQFAGTEVSFYCTGVGSMASCFFLTQLFSKNQFHFVLQLGIAGSFSNDFLLGSAVVVSKEFLADVGVYENNQWNDVFDMGFAGANTYPFKNKALPNAFVKNKIINNTIKAIGVTVNTITTNTKIKNCYMQKYNAQIESMEGAALHYACNSFKIPYLQIRGISNRVGQRNKLFWRINEAIESSNNLAFNLLLQLVKVQS